MAAVVPNNTMLRMDDLPKVAWALVKGERLRQVCSECECLLLMHVKSRKSLYSRSRAEHRLYDLNVEAVPAGKPNQIPRDHSPIDPSRRC